MPTQLEYALRKETTRQMCQVAKREFFGVDALREGIADGKVVIPANVNHRHLVPIGIGNGLRTKVNANIGTSPVRADLKAELRKLKVAIDAGADAVMDLSLAGDLDTIRAAIIEKSTVPVGTVPLYQALVECGRPENLTLDAYLRVFEKHALDGVDFATVHAGVTREAIPLLKNRLMPTVSRGGTFLVEWMKHHNRQSFLYEGFDKVLEIAKQYDVTISLGDGLRPGCIADATDEAQLFELMLLGKLVERCMEKGVQAMVEGPGHIPLNDIARNVRLAKDLCHGAPFYVLGPLATDSGAGYDHIVGAIGGALAGMHGADFLCYLTPKEHVGLPDENDVEQGVVATRIAAHIADIAKGRPASKEQDRRMSEARAKLDWSGMARNAVDPHRFRELAREECEGNPHAKDGCSMCGSFCTEKRKSPPAPI